MLLTAQLSCLIVAFSFSWFSLNIMTSVNRSFSLTSLVFLELLALLASRAKSSWSWSAETNDPALWDLLLLGFLKYVWDFWELWVWIQTGTPSSSCVTFPPESWSFQLRQEAVGSQLLPAASSAPQKTFTVRRRRVRGELALDRLHDGSWRCSSHSVDSLCSSAFTNGLFSGIARPTRLSVSPRERWQKNETRQRLQPC